VTADWLRNVKGWIEALRRAELGARVVLVISQKGFLKVETRSGTRSAYVQAISGGR